MKEHISINQYSECGNFYSLITIVGMFEYAVYIFLKNIQVNETIREYGMKYLKRLNIYK